MDNKTVTTMESKLDLITRLLTENLETQEKILNVLCNYFDIDLIDTIQDEEEDSSDCYNCDDMTCPSHPYHEACCHDTKEDENDFNEYSEEEKIKLKNSIIEDINELIDLYERIK